MADDRMRTSDHSPLPILFGLPSFFPPPSPSPPSSRTRLCNPPKAKFVALGATDLCSFMLFLQFTLQGWKHAAGYGARMYEKRTFLYIYICVCVRARASTLQGSDLAVVPHRLFRITSHSELPVPLLAPIAAVCAKGFAWQLEHDVWFDSAGL